MTDIFGWLFLCGGGCPVHCKVFSSIPGLYSLDAGNKLSSPNLRGGQPNASRLCQMLHLGQNFPRLRSKTWKNECFKSQELQALHLSYHPKDPWPGPSSRRFFPTGQRIDGWMASLTQWTWVWANFWRWWWTGKPGVPQSMGSQRTRHDRATEQQTIYSRGDPLYKVIAHSFKQSFNEVHAFRWPSMKNVCVCECVYVCSEHSMELHTSGLSRVYQGSDLFLSLNIS